MAKKTVFTFFANLWSRTAGPPKALFQNGMLWLAEAAMHSSQIKRCLLWRMNYENGMGGCAFEVCLLDSLLAWMSVLFPFLEYWLIINLQNKPTTPLGNNKTWQ